MGQQVGTGTKTWPSQRSWIQRKWSIDGNLLTEAHRACCDSIKGPWLRQALTRSGWMRGQRGGSLHPLPQASNTGPKYVLTGSHYDTVRNGGNTMVGWAFMCPLPACSNCTPTPKLIGGHEVVALPKKKANATRPHFSSGALVGQFNTHGSRNLMPMASACRRHARCWPSSEGHRRHQRMPPTMGLCRSAC